MYKLVMIRHGESAWNKENRFTGWTDVDLTEYGIEEAKRGGKTLFDENYTFDVAYTSVLKRAIRSLWLVLDEMNLHWIEEIKHWRLNERHYGSLQGNNKAETLEKYGEEQFMIWRRSYDTPPPPLSEDDKRNAFLEERYKSVDKNLIPRTECLKDCLERVIPYWENEIVPKIKSGKKVLIVSHGNTMRSIVKMLDNVSDDAISNLNIPTGFPLVYELDENMKPIKPYYYLGDQEKIEAAIKGVASQGKK